MSDSYDWKAPEVQKHWEAIRENIRAGRSVGCAPDPDFELRSARKQLARCERDAEEWRAIIRKLESRNAPQGSAAATGPAENLARAALRGEDPLMEEAKAIAERQRAMGGRNVYVPGYGYVRVPLKRAR